MGRFRKAAGLALLVLCVAAPGCRRKHGSKGELPPVAENEKKPSKKSGSKKTDYPPTTYDFHHTMVKEITPENTAEKLAAIEQELAVEQAQLAEIKAARKGDKGDKQSEAKKSKNDEGEAMPTPSKKAAPKAAAAGDGAKTMPKPPAPAAKPPTVAAPAPAPKPAAPPTAPPQ